MIDFSPIFLCGGYEICKKGRKYIFYASKIYILENS